VGEQQTGAGFARLNLRWNPFGEVPWRDRARIAVSIVPLEPIVEALGRPGFAVELVGACGRGKSTHLAALHARFPRLPVTMVAPGTQPRIPTASVVFVDESQRLSRWRRRRLFRRPVSFALGTHESHGDELRAAGLRVRTIHVAQRGLTEIVDARLRWARRGPGEVPRVPAGELDALVERHGDDQRAIEDALYLHYQRLRDDDAPM